MLRFGFRLGNRTPLWTTLLSLVAGALAVVARSAPLVAVAARAATGPTWAEQAWCWFVIRTTPSLLAVAARVALGLGLLGLRGPTLFFRLLPRPVVALGAPTVLVLRRLLAAPVAAHKARLFRQLITVRLVTLAGIRRLRVTTGATVVREEQLRRLPVVVAVRRQRERQVPRQQTTLTVWPVARERLTIFQVQVSLTLVVVAAALTAATGVPGAAVVVVTPVISTGQVVTAALILAVVAAARVVALRAEIQRAALAGAGQSFFATRIT